MVRPNGIELAKAEKVYKMTLSKECLKLKTDGMAIGLIDKVCYGIPEIADLRFMRDVADINLKANIEAINVLKLKIKIMDEQIKREWGSNG